MAQVMAPQTARNVLGGPLALCCSAPTTGFFRDGYCNTNNADAGIHTVCAVMTEEFLDFSRQRGNDLSTARPDFGFPGLSPGDRWCLCAGRWAEADDAGMAPPVLLESCHMRTLEVVSLDRLKAHRLQ